jgi:DNA polymerase III alpha subunit (gram-positive type)
MTELSDTEVFVLDCQSTGATPELGDLLELGWTITAGTERGEPVRAHWVVPRSGRRVPRIVRELTGFRDECLKAALPPEECWTLLENEVSARGGSARAVIHFAHFELAFLRDLHARSAPAASGRAFPFDAVCLHAVARRLYPDLARRSLRALAGMHGFPSELVRRSEGHVKATAHLWRALVPELERRGLRTWADLHGWLEEPAPKRTRRRYPLPPEKRRLLPAGPGVYRWLVMPRAAMSRCVAPAEESAFLAVASCDCQIASGSCST